TVRIIIYYPQEIGRNVDEILRALRALQTSDDNKVATPANWPENELIGNKVIIPPPQDEKSARERVEKMKSGEIEGYDWWFCYKSLEG
ncbi:MAG: peroxiredoxin, partial [Archaeoglobi archaeon]|nr:peroxiredoxin [Candidatus Mnemosynella bozhongmuii]